MLLVDVNELINNIDGAERFDSIRDVEEVERAIEETNPISVESFSFGKGDIVVIRFNRKEYPLERVHRVHSKLKEFFPNNEVVCFPDDLSLETMSVEQLSSIISKLSEIIERCVN